MIFEPYSLLLFRITGEKGPRGKKKHRTDDRIFFFFGGGGCGVWMPITTSPRLGCQAMIGNVVFVKETKRKTC